MVITRVGVPGCPRDDSMSGMHEKVTDSAGGITDPKGEQCVEWIGRAFGLVQNRIECAIEQCFDHGGRRVERPGMFTSVTGTGIGVERAGGVPSWCAFQQEFMHHGQLAFIHRFAVFGFDHVVDELLRSGDPVLRSPRAKIVHVGEAQVVAGGQQPAPCSFRIACLELGMLQIQHCIDEQLFIKPDIRVGGRDTPRGWC